MNRILTAALLTLALAACSDAPEKPAPAAAAPQARGKSAAIQISAAVEKVDVAQRLITLKGPDGKSGVYAVGKEVQRLSEVRVGDTIRADYTVEVLAELRAPTEAEKNDPVVFAEATHRASAGPPPQGAIARMLRVVTTVDGMDATAGTVTVKSPQGSRVTAVVDDKSVLPSLKIGQPIVVTFSETLLLTVQPGPK